MYLDSCSKDIQMTLVEKLAPADIQSLLKTRCQKWNNDTFWKRYYGRYVHPRYELDTNNKKTGSWYQAFCQNYSEVVDITVASLNRLWYLRQKTAGRYIHWNFINIAQDGSLNLVPAVAVRNFDDPTLWFKTFRSSNTSESLIYYSGRIDQPSSTAQVIKTVRFIVYPWRKCLRREKICLTSLHNSTYGRYRIRCGEYFKIGIREPDWPTTGEFEHLLDCD